MNELSQMLLAAGEKNVDGNWIELLIPVVIIIVYAIGGILKMRSNMKEQQSEDQPDKKPRYKPLADEGWGGASGREAATPEMSPAQRQHVDKRIERQLAPPVRTQSRRAPGRTTAPEKRKTLEAFLDTVAPKPLAAKVAEEQARIKAKSQEQRLRQTSQRTQAARKRKPKVSQAARRPKLAPAEKEQLPAPLLSPSLAERLAESSEVRRAIVYAEILGKPVGLRDM